MSFFGLLIGLIIVIVIYNSRSVLSDRQLFTEWPISQSVELFQSKMVNFSQSLLGPYWNTFYRPTYLTNDNEYAYLSDNIKYSINEF